MNFKKRASGVVLAVVMVLTMMASIASGQDRGHDKTLIGVWRGVITLRNCKTDDPLGSFKGLFMFNEGGTTSGYGVGPGSSPALTSPQFGVWQRDHGWQAYSFTLIFYRYDVTGALIGSQKIKATLQLSPNGDEFTTNSAIQILDVDDKVVGTGCGTTAGTRFE